MDWKLIDTHRKSAREVSFRILVWGPSSNDSDGYNLRLCIILEFEEFSRKSVIVLDEQTWERIKHSLSCAKWQNFGAKLLILPSDKWSSDGICSKLDEVIETFQFSEYIRNLKLRLI